MKHILFVTLILLMVSGAQGQTFPYNGFFQYQRPLINPAALPEMVYEHSPGAMANFNVRKPIGNNESSGNIADYNGLFFGAAQFNLFTRNFTIEDESAGVFFPIGFDFQTDRLLTGNIDGNRFNLRIQAAKSLGGGWLSVGINLAHTSLNVANLRGDFLFQDPDNDPVLQDGTTLTNCYLGMGVFYHRPTFHAGLSMPELWSFKDKAQDILHQQILSNRTWHLLLGYRLWKCDNCNYFTEFNSWIRFTPNIKYQNGGNHIDAAIVIRPNLRLSPEHRLFLGAGAGINQRAQGEFGFEFYPDDCSNGNGAIIPFRISILYDKGFTRPSTVSNLELNLSIGLH